MEKEPAHIKVDVNRLLCLTRLSKDQNALMFTLLKRAYDADAIDNLGMCVVMTPTIKNDISKELGWTHKASLDNALSRLVSMHYLYKYGCGIFRINPYIFGKGKMKDIIKLRKVVHDPMFEVTCNE